MWASFLIETFFGHSCGQSPLVGSSCLLRTAPVFLTLAMLKGVADDPIYTSGGTKQN